MSGSSLSDLKRLREQTSAGLASCKKALKEAGGDYDKAVALVEKMGHEIAAKKSGREASDGFIAAKSDGKFAVMIELNCETDFVARNEKFQVYAQKVLDIAHAERVRSKDELLGLSAEDGTFVSDMIVQMISVFRENIVLSRLTFELAQDNEVVGCYVHNKYTEDLGKFGVLTKIASAADPASLQSVAKSVCIQVMSGGAIAVSAQDLDDAVVQAQKDKYTEEIKGKPQNIAEKIIAGKLKKFYKECVLLEQDFYADSEKSVDQYLKEQSKKLGHEIKVCSYKAFKLGITNE